MKRELNGNGTGPFVLAGRARAASQPQPTILVLRQTASRAVSDTRTISFTEQPPAIDTELLEWSAPRSSLKRQTISLVVSSTEQPPATLERSTTRNSIQ